MRGPGSGEAPRRLPRTGRARARRSHPHPRNRELQAPSVLLARSAVNHRVLTTVVAAALVACGPSARSPRPLPTAPRTSTPAPSSPPAPAPNARAVALKPCRDFHSAWLKDRHLAVACAGTVWIYDPNLRLRTTCSLEAGAIVRDLSGAWSAPRVAVLLSDQSVSVLDSETCERVATIARVSWSDRATISGDGRSVFVDTQDPSRERCKYCDAVTRADLATGLETEWLDASLRAVSPRRGGRGGLHASR